MKFCIALLVTSLNIGIINDSQVRMSLLFLWLIVLISAVKFILNDLI